MQKLPALRPYAAKLRTRISVRRVWELSPFCDCPSRPVQPLCCICGGNQTANYRGCVKWKKAKADLAKQAPTQGRRAAATSRAADPEAKRAGPSSEQMDLG